ncbi:MAG: hypothetical protein NVS9B10_18440 [Nevskia sp.]
MKKILGGAVAVTGLAIAGALLYVGSGRFEIGADSPHSAPVAALLGYARERALAAHARGLNVPALDDPKRVASGASEYAEMCAGCHLAPGMADNELRPGLYPQPPNLSEPLPPAANADASRALAARAFWVVKHGIKMSAMPAWGLTHDDETIWNIVAFLQKLPQLSAAQYAAMTADAESAHEDAGHGDDEAAPPHHHHGPASETPSHAD